MISPSNTTTLPTAGNTASTTRFVNFGIYLGVRSSNLFGRANLFNDLLFIGARNCAIAISRLT